MNGLPYYKRYARDFLDGVQGIGPELIGTYTTILDLMYARGEDFLRRDDRHLAGLMGCSIRKARALTDRLIEIEKIELDGDFIVNSRAKSELKLTRNQREASVKGGRNSKPNQQKQRVKQSHTRSQDTDTDTDKKGYSNEYPKKNDLLKAAFDAYNEVAKDKGIPQAQLLTDTRQARLKARLADVGGLDGWHVALNKLACSSFLTGANDTGWKANLDFLLQASSLTKLMEGNYDDGPTREHAAHDHVSQQRRDALRALAENIRQHESDQEEPVDLGGPGGLSRENETGRSGPSGRRSDGIARGRGHPGPMGRPGDCCAPSNVTVLSHAVRSMGKNA